MNAVSASIEQVKGIYLATVEYGLHPIKFIGITLDEVVDKAEDWAKGRGLELLWKG